MTQTARPSQPPAGHTSQRKNLALLLSGFLIGQGSVFVVQTYLLGSGKVDLVGSYGVTFSLLVLTQYLVDFGGAVTLARSAVEDINSLEKLFWSLVVVRLIVLATMSATALVLVQSVDLATLAASYTLAALPGLAANAFNAAGVLDGIQASGANGLISALQYVLTAAALPIAAQLEPAMAGLVLGAAMSLALIASVALQHHFLRTHQRPLARASISWSMVRRMARDGFLYLTTWTPSQLIYRAQLVVLSTTVGPTITGLFIYARQISSAVLQAVQFVRRVEFPGLVALVTSSTTPTIRTLLATQRTSYALGLVGSAALVALGTVLKFLTLGRLSDASSVILLVAIIPVVASLYGNATQIAYAKNATNWSSLTAVILLALSIGPLLIFPEPAVVTVVVLEAIANVVAGSCLWLLLRRFVLVTPMNNRPPR